MVHISYLGLVQALALAVVPSVSVVLVHLWSVASLLLRAQLCPDQMPSQTQTFSPKKFPLFQLFLVLLAATAVAVVLDSASLVSALLSSATSLSVSAAAVCAAHLIDNGHSLADNAPSSRSGFCHTRQPEPMRDNAGLRSLRTEWACVNA